MTMRCRHLAFSVAVVLSPIAAAAQDKPDFSGVWTAVGDPAPAGNTQPVRLFGQEFVLRHQGQTFSIERVVGDAKMISSHVLDGSETRSRRPGRLCEADSEFVYQAHWDGDAIRLRIVGQVPPGGGAVGKREVTWILRKPAADTLRVESVPAANAPSAATRPGTTYKRSGDAPAPAAPSAASQGARATIANVSWLAGVWAGTLGSSDIEERWTPPAGGSMLAISRTIRAGVMNAFEFLCIVEREGGLVYTAMPNGRQPATDFTLTKVEGGSVTFENPAHDFPKMIRYTRRADGSLEAVISGDATQKPISYVFKKQQ
jgi:hypothetical protein